MRLVGVLGVKWVGVRCLTPRGEMGRGDPWVGLRWVRGEMGQG